MKNTNVNWKKIVIAFIAVLTVCAGIDFILYATGFMGFYTGLVDRITMNFGFSYTNYVTWFYSTWYMIAIGYTFTGALMVFVSALLVKNKEN